jgi:hypothetical protein
MPKQKQSLKLPIFLIIGPALGLILSIILYAIINFILAGSAPVSDNSSSQSLSDGASIAQGVDSQELYGSDSTSMFRTISNILLFLLGAGSMLAFVPCLVFGIIILNKRRNPQESAAPATKDKDSRDWGDLE